MITQYFADLARLQLVSGANHGSAVRDAFKELLKACGRSRHLQFIAEYEMISPGKERRYIDGALLNDLRVPFGYWEEGGSNGDLDEEIAGKFRQGYPRTNIIFQDSSRAILIQHGLEVMRCNLGDAENLTRLLDLFFAYQQPETADFRKAIEQFRLELPGVLKNLRTRIDRACEADAPFANAAHAFLNQARAAISPAVTDADVRAMLIQHVLTEDILALLFGPGNIHPENSFAEALYGLEQLLFQRESKQQILHALEPCGAALRSTAALIQSHSEKQAFLKKIYQIFYHAYNAKAADRLGVVYTPREIVRFILEGADWLCERHFGKTLIETGVEILDPATGTGTFIVEFLERFRDQHEALKYKYQNEIHANEVAILPFCVARLNIAATYAAITADHADFHNLHFVDTLDNTTYRSVRTGQHYGDLFDGSGTRIGKAMEKPSDSRICVIIGNPPYNANQRNENENNRNQEYPEIDARIAATYIKASTAQKTKLYDMYSRFFRWASDQIEGDGIVALVTNRGFLDKRNFDGFRKTIAQEFSEIYVIDLGGDVRDNPKLSGTTHNVFGIQIGVAISFLVKHSKRPGCRIHYGRRPEFETKEEKLTFLNNTDLKDAAPDLIHPDGSHNWLGVDLSDFEALLPVVGRAARLATRGGERAIFKLFSLGIATNRDEWAYDKDPDNLARKVSFFIDFFEEERARWHRAGRPKNIRDWVRRDIKWTAELEALLATDTSLNFNEDRIRRVSYRPFANRWTYYDHAITHRIYQNDRIYPLACPRDNISIIFTGPSAQKPWMVSAADVLADLHYVGAGAGAVCVPRFRHNGGVRTDNITDWALDQFKAQYGDEAAITKDAIFAYVYGLLHDPIFRQTYAPNLKRDFPRIPFYPDFARWRDWGQILLDMHIGHRTIEPFPLGRTDTPDEKVRARGGTARVILKADRANGVIEVDAETKLSEVPPVAWRYVLGKRSAIEWVLDQYRERAPNDPTVREKFNSYRFADYKEEVIDLLQRVVTVSVRTVGITEAMRAAARSTSADTAHAMVRRDG